MFGRKRQSEQQWPFEVTGAILVKPGDTIILKSRNQITSEQADFIKAKFADLGLGCLIIVEGMIEVVEVHRNG